VSTYRVTWTIEVEAEDPFYAAFKAREIQLDPTSEATVFAVTDEDGRVQEEDIDYYRAHPHQVMRFIDYYAGLKS
jgi:hypothetical protein